MGVLFFLIPLALVVVAAAVLAFRWALADGQLDDLQTPSLRVLIDDPPHLPTKTHSRTHSQTHSR